MCHDYFQKLVGLNINRQEAAKSNRLAEWRQKKKSE